MGDSDCEVKKKLKTVLENIERASESRIEDLKIICPNPRLVAVAKTKPKDVIISAYAVGQRHFGENYVQELSEKAHDPELQSSCPDIKWHLIGHLQGNKVNKVLGCPNIHTIETVDSVKLANTINNAWGKIEGRQRQQLDVFVQINTSAEENKSGASPDKFIELVDHVVNKCPNLKFNGLMTIGIYDYDLANGPNPDFQKLLKHREELCENFSLAKKDVQLSMGMSTDYEHAVEVGATNIRVGSTIFGPRNVKTT